MKKNRISILAMLAIACTMQAHAQNVAINADGTLPDPNAALDIKSSNKGILIPRISTAARLALPNTRGLLVFDTATGGFWYNSGSAWLNIASTTTSTSGSSWGLSGNDLGTDTTRFIGSVSNTPFIVKVNNLLAGRIDAGLNNTSWGYFAGAAGSQDTLGGTAKNYAFGNTAIGNYTLHSNFIGMFNTASGMNAMYSNTYGIQNTATGVNALYANSNGFANTASGAASLVSNTSGNCNTADGYVALSDNTTGGYNTAFGYGALSINSTGSYNTAIGSNANVRVGIGGGNLTNATAIGSGAVVDVSNKIRLGNSAVTVIEGQVPFTTPSDGRFKYEVKEDVRGLDFILKLRPVTYRFDVSRFDAQHGIPQEAKGTNHTNYALQAAYNEASLIRRSGFIAQEVEKAAKASGYNFSGIITPKTEQEHYSLSYESFVVPLVKAVQEQQKTIDGQHNTIEEQNKKIAALQQQLDEIKQLLQPKK